MARMSAPVFDESYTANSDLSNSQYHIVHLTAADTMDLVSAAATIPLGVLLDAPAAGEVGLVRQLGWCDVVADGSGTAITVGLPVGPNASGVCVAKSAAGDAILGYAMDATSSAGVMIRVRLAPGVAAAVTG